VVVGVWELGGEELADKGLGTGLDWLGGTVRVAVVVAVSVEDFFVNDSLLAVQAPRANVHFDVGCLAQADIYTLSVQPVVARLALDHHLIVIVVFVVGLAADAEQLGSCRCRR